KRLHSVDGLLLVLDPAGREIIVALAGQQLGPNARPRGVKRRRALVCEARLDPRDVAEIRVARGPETRDHRRHLARAHGLPARGEILEHAARALGGPLRAALEEAHAIV